MEERSTKYLMKFRGLNHLFATISIVFFSLRLARVVWHAFAENVCECFIFRVLFAAISFVASSSFVELSHRFQNEIHVPSGFGIYAYTVAQF